MHEFREKVPTPGQVYLADVNQRFAEGDGIAFEHSPIDELIADSGRLALRENMELGVQGFLNESAEIAQERAQARERWTKGGSLPRVTEEAKELISSKTPPHVTINPDAMAGIQVRPANSYKIDLVSTDIMKEVAALLPRSIDSYRYKQGYAEDTVEIAGLGKVAVKLHSSNDIFKTISEIKIGDFRIWNCRETGLWYNSNLINTSNPSEIDLGADGGVKISLYSGESGIRVEKDGNETVYGGNYLGRKPESDWSQTQDEAIVWIAENILFPLQEAEKPAEQFTTLPESQPFPYEKIGPLVTFIEMKDLERTELIKDSPEKANPDERYAIRPGWRLVGLGGGAKDIPKEAYDGYIYAKLGKITEETDLSAINEIGREYRRTSSFFGGIHGFAQIRPKTAEDIYVVDWNEWEAYRERTFSETHTDLTDAELAENYSVVARTMVPVTNYDGSYKDPIVLIGRALKLDEVEALYPSPGDEY